MNIGKATAIFFKIASTKYTDDEKGTAILEVIQMPTHNGIKKDVFLCVIWYLLNICFDLPEGTRPPEAWEKLVKELADAEVKEAQDAEKQD